MNTTLLTRLRKGWAPALASAVLALGMAGCQADSDLAGLPGNGGNGNVGGTDNPTNPGGITDVTPENCRVPALGLGGGSNAADGICLLGNGNNNGLVNQLLDPNGPLGPVAGSLAPFSDILADRLGDLLQNDNSLTDTLQRLLAEGQLGDGLAGLLLGVDPDDSGERNGGLADLVTALIRGSDDEETGGLVKLVGGDVPGLLRALLIDGDDENACQAKLGTICLIAGEESDQSGLLDLVLNGGGLLSGLSPYLGGETNPVNDVLGDLLESDGSLAGLVGGLFRDGQLASGLQALLQGNEDDPEGRPGLVALLGDVLGRDPESGEGPPGLGEVLGDILGGLGGLFGR
ncbi:hypothetical protein [Sinimarinibacterium sp. NLF-5-8]|uniref:hypothetical protein n=1 Tax=Sinimarinibacterium sp. NLF-5-8 TaxID=2698684 RepID=UPI00137BB87F|nr:hypothetical protein [Sinimarinibacterium sp. NLF-5-8]QHS10201.1 hypothetical protein GT972_08625 [Sinimarinibacterium sp. NLF-5-8]